MEPRLKVVLVQKSTVEFEQLINRGWRVASRDPHPLGMLFIMAKPTVQGKKK